MDNLGVLRDGIHATIRHAHSVCCETDEMVPARCADAETLPQASCHGVPHRGMTLGA